MGGPTDGTTTAVQHTWTVRRWRIEVLTGPSAGLRRTVDAGTLRLGSGADAELRLADPTASRLHAAIDVAPDGVRVRDLGSKNGTFLAGARIEAIRLPATGGVIAIGASEIGLFPVDDALPLAPATTTRCGRLVGQSERARLLFAQLERLAATTATVLLHGETGTGKELCAQAIHDGGPRRDRPLVVVDCGAIPRELVESELFGHARGAFTGAVAEFKGAFERADGGTLFLDEIGDLPLDLQPKLLRALETGTVRPLGRERTREVDVRVIAASHHDLRALAGEGRFRQDLYYRLAVVVVEVPPLRERLDDLPLIAGELVRALGAPPLDATALRALGQHAWPGNVRELRNVLARAAALAGDGPLRIEPTVFGGDPAEPVPLRLPYKQAKDLMVARFTREYLEELLRRHDGNVSAAAREAGLDRNWIVELARRHGVRIRD